MKSRHIAIICLVTALAVASLVFAACTDKPDVQQLTELTLPELDNDQMAVIIKNADDDYTVYTVTLNEEITTGEDAIEYLVGNSELYVKWTDGDYGKYIEELGTLKPSENEFIVVMTSVEKDKGAWAGVASYEIGDITIVESQVGVSDMTVEAGAIIYFEIAVSR